MKEKRKMEKKVHSQDQPVVQGAIETLGSPGWNMVLLQQLLE